MGQVVMDSEWHHTFTSLGLFFLVALIWGGTNPFLKRGTKGLKSVKSNTLKGQLHSELIHLLTNWQYVSAFLINQIGSLLYFFVLQRSLLSLAVPITNSVTFVFTALTGRLLGEEPLTPSDMLGICLVIIGTTICYLDKS